MWEYVGSRDAFQPITSCVTSMNSGMSHWHRENDCLNMCSYICRSCDVVPPPLPCDGNIPADYVNRCGQLNSASGPFGPCIAQLNAQSAGTSTTLYDNCILDACNSNGAGICNNVRSLVDRCANIGIQVDCNAWQTTTNCREYHTAVYKTRFMITI